MKERYNIEYKSIAFYMKIKNLSSYGIELRKYSVYVQIIFDVHMF